MKVKILIFFENHYIPSQSTGLTQVTLKCNLSNPGCETISGCQVDIVNCQPLGFQSMTKQQIV